MAKIVLSYRREDTKHITGWIHEKLQDHFGIGNVFMDIDSMPIGLDFRDHLQDVLKNCDILIAVVGPNWLKLDSAGRSHLHEKSDWVRIEIAAALEKSVPVVPLLIDGTPMPTSEQLPEDMQAFAFRHAARVDSGVNFRGNMQQLTTAVDRLVAARAALPSMPPQIDEAVVAPISAEIPNDEPELQVEVPPIDVDGSNKDEEIIPGPLERPEEGLEEKAAAGISEIKVEAVPAVMASIRKPALIAASLLVLIGVAIWLVPDGPPAPVTAGNDPLAGTWCAADGSELSAPSKITKYSDGSYVADFYAITTTKRKGGTDFVSNDNSLRLALKQTDQDTLEGKKIRQSNQENVKFVRCK